MSAVATSNQSQKIAPLSKLWWVGLVAGVASAVANLIFFFITSAAGVVYMIPLQGPESPLEALPAFAVIMASFVPAIGATVLFFLLGRFLSQGVRIFVIVSVLFLIASFALPFTLPATVAISAKIALNVMHVISGSVIMGVLLRWGR